MEEETYSKPVHIWTDEEILDPPNASIWFYGLVNAEQAAPAGAQVEVRQYLAA